MGLRVANVIEDGRLGGPQIRIAEVGRQLKKTGIETLVVRPYYQSDLFKQKLDQYGVKTIGFPIHRLTKDKKHLLKYMLYFFYEIILLYRFFKKERFDVVHCSGGSWQYKGVIAGKLAGSKTLWHLNDTNMPVIVRLLFRFVSKYFVDGLIVAGNRVEKYYVKSLEFKSIPIYEIQAPVDTAMFDPEKVVEDPEIAAYEGLRIVTVGNINPLKGIEYFVQMASILNKYHDNLNFFVIGPHFDSQTRFSKKLFELAKLLKTKNLHFYGPSNNIASVLKATDIYVCCSLTEASPISVWEAMSMAKSIVSTDVGDVARFINDGENGFVCPIKNAAALAEKVELLIKDEELRKRFGQKARDVVVKYLDISVCTKKHITFYKKLIKKGANR